VATELDKIEERRDRSNLTAASQILAGLVLDEYTISEINISTPPTPLFKGGF